MEPGPSKSQEEAKQRVSCYVDGFNLYYGLRDSGFKKYLWLDLCGLARAIILPNQRLVFTKYFTARISGGRPTDTPDFFAQANARRKRQADYLDAVGSLSDLAVFEGQFLAKQQTCKKCLASWATAEEKMTDVNIATEMLVDAFADAFDTALLISGDSDLVPPINAILETFPGKRVIVAFPPGRFSEALRKAASGQFKIAKGHLKKSQLPEEIELPSGYVIRRPETWR